MADEGKANRTARRIAPAAIACLVVAGGCFAFAATTAGQASFDPSSYLAGGSYGQESGQLDTSFDLSSTETDSQANKQDDESKNTDEGTVEALSLDEESPNTAYQVDADGDAAASITLPGTGDGAAGSETVDGPVVNGGGAGTGGSTNTDDPDPTPTYNDTYGDLSDDNDAKHYDSQGNEVLGITVSGSIGDDGTVLLGASTSDASLFSNIIVTAQKRSPSGTEFSETLSFGDYTVQANTARTGNYSALFEYCGVSASLNYTVTQLYNALRVSVYTNNRYYVTSPYISSSGYPIGSKGYVYASSGSSIVDMSSIFRQILAWYDADTPGLNKDTYYIYINHEKTTLKPDEDGYLVNMAMGFSSNWDKTNDVWTPYSLIADLNNTSVRQYLKVGPVPDGALLRLVSTEEGGAQMGDQVFVGCTFTDDGSFTVPYGTTKIALEQECSDLTSLTIPGSVMSIDAASLNQYAPKLASFDVDDDNANFRSINGLLMDKASTTVLAVPAGLETIELPKGATLSEDALAGRTNAITITVTDAEPSDALLAGITAAAKNMGEGGTITIEVPGSENDVTYKRYLAAWGPTLPSNVTLAVTGEPDVPGTYTLRDDGSIVRSGNASILSAVPWNATSYDVSGIVEVETQALCTAPGLTSISFDDALTKLDDGALDGESLSFVSCAAVPPNAGKKLFGASAGNITVSVPDESLAAYKLAWTTQIDSDYGLGTTEKILSAASELSYIDGGYYRTNADGSYTLVKVSSSAGSAFTVADGTTILANGCFNGCTGIVSIQLPESVTTIEANAFGGATALELVALPSSVTQLATSAFTGCTSLKAIACNGASAPSSSLALSAEDVAIYVPSGCESAYAGWEGAGTVAAEGASYAIDDDVLSAQTAAGADILRAASTLSGTFSLPADAIAVADGAFEGCAALDGIDASAATELASIGANAFAGCTALAAIDLSACTALTAVGEGTFQGCTALASAAFGDAVVAIPDDCFNGCTALASISVSSELVSIGDRAFKECVALPSLSFVYQSTLATIGDEAFSGCTVLRYGSSSATYLPDSVSSIGAGAFENCANIKDVVLPASLATLRESTFANCSSLQTVKLTAPIYAIGKYCFANCAVLNDVALRSTTAAGTTSYAAEETLMIIGVEAFKNCSALSSMDLSGADALAVVGARAFEDCTTLSSIRFASGIAALQGDCFAGCTSLVDLNLPGDTAPSIGATIFGSTLDADNTTVYVGESSHDAYVDAWTAQLDGDYGEGTTEKLLRASADGTVVLAGVTYEVNDDGTYTLLKASASLTGSYTVMAGTTYIADRAFEGCTGLTSLSFPANDPDTTVSFGNECFKGCTGLTEVTFNCNVPSMGYSVFEGCTGLVSFTVSDGYTIERFGTRCFAGCTALGSGAPNTYVSLAGVVKIFGEECFADCTSLTALSVSDSYKQGITAVEDRAFINCTALSTFPIGNSKSTEYTALNTLGVEIFKGCTSLTSVYVPAGFTGTLPEGMFQDCTSLQYCSFISGVTAIGKNCFKGCTSLIRTGGDATAKAALTTIEEGAYEGCTNLTTYSGYSWGLGIYPNLIYIGDRAFYGCSANFTEAVFANAGMTYIGADAFAGCSSLATMSFAGESLPTIKNLNLSDYASGFTITSSAYGDDESAADANATIYDNYLDALTELVGDTQAEAILAKPSTVSSGSSEGDASNDASEASIASVASVETAEGENAATKGENEESADDENTENAAAESDAEDGEDAAGAGDMNYNEASEGGAAQASATATEP